MSFHVLCSPREVDGPAVTDFLDEGRTNLGDAPRCPKCGAFIGALPWLPPYVAELEVWGKEYGDIAFGPGDELLLIERAATAFQQEGLSGLAGFHDVAITRVIRRGGSKLRLPAPRYIVVAVTRSRAAIDFSASELIQETPYTCDECRTGIVKRAERIILEPGTWSGEDVFYARGLPGTILTSERFRDFFDRNRINNGVLTNALDYSFDSYRGERAGK